MLSCSFAIIAKSELAISQLRTAKHLWIVWRDNTKWQKKLEVEIIKDASLSLKKASKVVCTIRSMTHDWCFLSHCPSKQSMHALRFYIFLMGCIAKQVISS